MRDDARQDGKQATRKQESAPDRLSHLIVAIVTFLGALGLLALLYFPLRYLR